MGTFYCRSVSLETQTAIGGEGLKCYGEFLSYLCNFKTFMTEGVRVLRRYGGGDAKWGRGNGIFFQAQGAEGEKNNSTNTAA